MTGDIIVNSAWTLIRRVWNMGNIRSNIRGKAPSRRFVPTIGPRPSRQCLCALRMNDWPGPQKSFSRKGEGDRSGSCGFPYWRLIFYGVNVIRASTAGALIILKSKNVNSRRNLL